MEIVLNADDFGLSADTVAATVECLENGLLTGATIMAKMPASAEALSYARSRPDLSFGVHLTFVGDGLERSVAEPDELSRLVNEDGTFRRTRDVRVDALLRRLPVAAIARETAAQIQAVIDAGVPVSHVDSHRHLHKFGPFRAALREVLPRFGITRVRNVQNVYVSRPLLSPTYWLGGVWRRLLLRDFETTENFYMPTTSGDLAWHVLADRIGELPGATLEVGMHPGVEEDWRRLERESLAPFVAEVVARGHSLVGWREVRLRHDSPSVRPVRARRR